MNKENNFTIDKLIIKLVQTKKPSNIQQLIDLTKSEANFITDEMVLKSILHLEKQNKIKLKEQLISTPLKFSMYLKTEAMWYWITIVLAIATALSIFSLPDNSYPLTYVRHILGAFFILFLPGYSLTKFLFSEKELDNIEHTALTIGLSLTLVAITGLVLNYTVWGIRTFPITLSLLIFILIFATAGIIREHQLLTK